MVRGETEIVPSQAAAPKAGELSMSLVCMKERCVGVVSLSGPLTAATANAFRTQLLAWQGVETDVKNYVFNLSEMDFMDSVGLGSLIAVLKRIAENGGDMRLACLQKKPRMVIDITRAYQVFRIFDSVEDAIESFANLPC